MKQLLRSPQLRFRKTSDNDDASSAVDASAVDLSTDGPDAADPEQVTLAWTAVAGKATSATQFGLIASLLCGPVAVVLLLLSGSAPAVVAEQQTATNGVSADQVAASAFAEDLVVTWLSTPEGEDERVESYGPAYSSITLPKTPWVVTDSATAAMEQSEDGQTWTVTVAVSVSASAGSAPIRRYFRVPVHYAGGALAARALPTPVAAPAVANVVTLDYRFRAAPSDAVGAAAEDFLSGMLVGGDVERYISPTAEISAILPSPYTAVEVEEIRLDQELTEADEAPETGRTLRMLVTADAAVGRDQVITVQYALTMTAREGRWEVAAIDPAPLLSGADPEAAFTDGAAPQSPGDTTDQDPSGPLGGEITEDEFASEEPSPTGNSTARPSPSAGETQGQS